MLGQDEWFWVFVSLVMGNVLVGMPALLILGALIPRQVKNSYLCPPYYTLAELKWRGVFPISLVNQAALACMFVWPHLGLERKVLPKGGELSPAYRMALKLYFWLTVVTVPTAIISLAAYKMSY